MSMMKHTQIIVVTLMCLMYRCTCSASGSRHNIASAATSDEVLDIQDAGDNDTLPGILCHSGFSGTTKCRNKEVLLRLGYCATYVKGKGVYISRCPYYQLKGHTVSISEPGYIELPYNISELNNYMCGPMNREDFFCKDCIDGFGPSITSVGYQCSNCTDAWYGVPLFLIVKFVPMTLFYISILLFKIHLVSPPMMFYIIYSHFIVYEILFRRSEPVEKLVAYYENNTAFKSILLFYGIWNLDFVRYISPPFCVSSRLKPTHIEILDYFSNFYLLFLLLFTWMCIEMHGRNFRPLVWLWKPFHKCFVRFQRKWDLRNNMIDVFASLFLLFYIKLVYLGSVLYQRYGLDYTMKGKRQTGSVDIDGYIMRQQLTLFVIPLLTVFSLIPVLLLVLYPFKLFRRCLSKCRLDHFFVTVFVEKFHGCYRDGLNGGRDMRSFGGLYLLLILLLSNFSSELLAKLKIYDWIGKAVFPLTGIILIALLRPYKKSYMTISDILLLTHLLVVCLLLSRDYFNGEETQLLAVMSLPAVVLGLFVIFKVLASFKSIISTHCKCCCRHRTDSSESVKIVHHQKPSKPTNTVVDIASYGTYDS